MIVKTLSRSALNILTFSVRLSEEKNRIALGFVKSANLLMINFDLVNKSTFKNLNIANMEG